MGAELACKEDGVGEDKRVEEHQVLDHRQQQPGAIEPENSCTSESWLMIGHQDLIHQIGQLAGDMGLCLHAW